MTRLPWALARLPVSLLATGMRRMGGVLPEPETGRSRLGAAWRPAALGLRALGGVARAGSRRSRDPGRRWTELANKIAAFTCFRSAGGPRPAREACAAPPDEPFTDLWRREGIGYLSGREAVGSGVLPSAAAIPRRDLIPHHTGLGLGLAYHHLEDLRARSPAAEIRRALRRFLDDCAAGALPGYSGAVIEALGLTVRLSHPALLYAVDEELRSEPPEVRSFFWHGVGRGIYFDPSGLAPTSGLRWRALERAIGASRDEEALANAVSGVAWATTLVNFRHPEVLAARLALEPRLDTGDAVANGVASVILLWRDAVGDDSLLRAFRGHRPAADDAVRELWRRRVAEPTAIALRQVYPLLRAERRLGELFRWRPQQGWRESLGGADGSRPESYQNPRRVPIHG